MSEAPVIAVDGPSGVGKGMITRWLAQRLNWHRLDSGALYRVVALAAEKRGIDSANASAVAAIAPQIDIRFEGGGEDDEAILVDGEDWKAQVRAETTGALASRIAALPEVRAALLKRQREFRRLPGLVADGRDMGTVVFPDASLKIFLDASVEERARRRASQLSKAGLTVNIPRLCDEIRARDDRDRNRTVAPLRPATDAELVDTTGLPPDVVQSKVGAFLHRLGL